jgi:branched-chain amino acid transport system ATP-binding protein
MIHVNAYRENQPLRRAARFRIVTAAAHIPDTRDWHRRKGERSAMGEPLLQVRDVTVRFGGVVALDGVSFEVERGQIAGLIGPNGAGKTTLFNCLSRLYQPSAGEISFEGTSVLATPRHQIAAMGIGRTFQNVALFDRLTVLENVMAGQHSGTDSSFLANALRLPSVVREQAAARERAMDLIGFMDLGAFVHWPAGGLPFPIRKRVELARALAARPKLLLLDEPAAGLNHDEVATLEGQIRRVRDSLGVTVLLVEHHMALVMSVSDKVVTVNFGRKIAEGTPDEIRRHPEVISAYLGTTAQ